MKVDMITLANYAEDHGGLLTMVGAGWDTINVQAPIEGASPGVFTLVQGWLVVRMLFHQTEADRDHRVEITVNDADGQQIARIDANAHLDRSPDTPPGWDQGMNIVIGLSGMPLPHEGHYVINLNVDGQFLADRPFRVVKRY